MLTDGRQTTDAGVTGILIAHLGAFSSGELKIVDWNVRYKKKLKHVLRSNCLRSFTREYTYTNLYFPSVLVNAILT